MILRSPASRGACAVLAACLLVSACGVSRQRPAEPVLPPVLETLPADVKPLTRDQEEVM